MKTFFRCCLLLTPLFFNACTIHKVGDETAVTLDTGNDVVDAASYVVAGAKLQKKLNEKQRENDGFNQKKDPVVKQMDAAIEKAKDRKHGLSSADKDSAATSPVIEKTSQSGGG